jgi:hypothetical protein
MGIIRPLEIIGTSRSTAAALSASGSVVRGARGGLLHVSSHLPNAATGSPAPRLQHENDEICRRDALRMFGSHVARATFEIGPVIFPSKPFSLENVN